MWLQFEPPPDDEPVLAVSELTAQIKAALQDEFPKVKVSGEISDLARPRSGHVYLTMKDEAAQIRAVIWRNAAQKLKVDLADGMEVIGTGRIDVYPPRGTYQLILEDVEVSGVGAMERALRLLREKLAAEGLFDQEHKKPIPRFPLSIAVITSPTSAALRDFLEVAKRRWSQGRIYVLPAQMQGDSAANEVRQAIELAHEIVPRPDVMVITRGGGSIEDLWAFNDEQLVRKIHAAEIPVVSAIGHEIDVTLCDLVADLRALTPSEAAERMVPSQDELRQSLRVDAGRLQRALHRLADHTRLRLDAMLRLPVFRRPWDLVNQRSQYLDESQRRISQAVQHSFSQATRKVEHFEKRLDALNPKAVLGRGYSITMHSDGASVVRSADGMELGSKIHTVLASGELVSEVTERRVKDQGS